MQLKKFYKFISHLYIYLNKNPKSINLFLNLMPDNNIRYKFKNITK